jgi:hypothetical protein
MAELDDFLTDLGREVSWDVIMIQEFSSTTAEIPMYTSLGHRVLAQPPCQGQRRAAVIIHVSHNHCVRGSEVRGRHLAVDMCWAEEFACRFVSSHMPSTNVPDDYRDSVSDLEAIACGRPKGSQIVIGIDGQDSVGDDVGNSDFYDLGVIGNHAVGARGWKGELLLNAVEGLGLSLRNTFFTGVGGDQFTCHFDLRRPARQIDYAISNLRRVEARVLDSSATGSDHRPLSIVIPYKSVRWLQQTARAKLVKPIGWIKTDANYNLMVQEQLGLIREQQPCDGYVEGVNSFVMFLDGSK